MFQPVKTPSFSSEITTRLENGTVGLITTFFLNISITFIATMNLKLTILMSFGFSNEGVR